MTGLREATIVYALYTREDAPSVSYIARKVFGEDTEANRKLVHQRIEEKRRAIREEA